MNSFTTIRNFFKKRDNRPTKAGKKWVEGYSAFERAKEHYLAGGENHSVIDRIQDALDCFDEAIASGFEDGGIYGSRGSCLQMLNFHLDAVEDFNKAIPLDPEDSNLYFMRSLSKGATDDLHGSVAHLQDAIRVSAIDNHLNKTYNLWAKQYGYDSITAKHKHDLLHANLDVEQQADKEVLRNKCPGLDLGPDLVSRRRAKSRRRTQHE